MTSHGKDIHNKFLKKQDLLYVQSKDLLKRPTMITMMLEL